MKRKALKIGVLVIIFIVLIIIIIGCFFIIPVKKNPITFLKTIFNIEESSLYDIFWKNEITSPKLYSEDIGKTYRSILDNSVLREKENTILSVMIENHPASRPQMHGLSKSGIVYEALAEGRITRFLAIFSYQNLIHVGPVRSARPYYINLAEGYGGSYAHAGGSSDGLALIQNSELINLEALYYEELGKYFYRDKKYYAPHNLFANFIELKELIKEKKGEKNYEEPFLNFNKDSISENYLPASEITVNFSEFSYKAKFQYNNKTEKYLRFLGGKPHIDNIDNSQIAPSNVIIMFTNYYVKDEKGRLVLKVIGEGKAKIFTKGKVIDGTWSKPSRSAKIKFFTKDQSQKEVALNTGQTWICIIDSEAKVEVK